MTQAEFDRCRQQLAEEADGIAWAKRPAYTQGSADVLVNFKRAAADAGVEPGQALIIYMRKHWDAVVSALKDPSIPQAEPVLGRFADLRNYLDLGWALLCERGQRPPSGSSPIRAGVPGVHPQWVDSPSGNDYTSVTTAGLNLWEGEGGADDIDLRPSDPGDECSCQPDGCRCK